MNTKTVYKQRMYEDICKKKVPHYSLQFADANTSKQYCLQKRNETTLLKEKMLIYPSSLI